MKPVSHLALAAALVLGLTAAPVVAKTKDAPAAAATGPKFNLSKPFQAAAAPIQKALTANDFAGAMAALPAADAAATTPDDKYIAAKFRYSAAKGMKDEAGADAALKAILASGSVPATEVGQINYLLGANAYFAKDYGRAVSYFNTAITAKYPLPDMYIMAADASYKMNKFADGVALAQQGIAMQAATGQPVSEDFYARTYTGALNTKSDALSVPTGIELIRHYPTQSNWRSVLVNYRNFHQLDGQVSLDLFRLMRVANSVAGERDYYEYAALATERGLPGEAKAVVAEAFLRDKSVSSSRPLKEIGDLAGSKVAADHAGLAAAAAAAPNGKNKAGAASGRQALGVADAYLSYGEDAKAIPLYRLAISKATDVDMNAANMRLGIALARTGDAAGARAAFGLVQGPRADVAKFWLLYLDLGAKAPAA